MIAIRFIGPGTGERELYLLGRIGTALAVVLRFFIYRGTPTHIAFSVFCRKIVGADKAGLAYIGIGSLLPNIDHPEILISCVEKSITKNVGKFISIALLGFVLNVSSESINIGWLISSTPNFYRKTKFPNSAFL
ncbi:hypothetical protein J7J45_05560 [Candidatus Aerophobetes bacterium]|nr:hypothetical protein [Candidatus Aerophobetes bacterium]